MKLCRLILFLAIAFTLAASPRTNAADRPVVGEIAPPFEAVTLEGDKISLADLRGSVILLNFWATWCVPCKVEMPLLDTFYRKLKDRGLVVLAITTEDTLPVHRLRPVAQVLGFPLVRGLTGPYRIIDRSYPTNYIIDRSGVVRYAQPGAFNLDSLNGLLIPLLNEPVPAAEPAGKAL